MFEKFETSEEVEILTDPQTRALKGGGCSCKNSGSNYVSCTGSYSPDTTTGGDTNNGGDTNTTIDPTIKVPGLNP